MADIQATAEILKWTFNIITLVLMIMAASMAIKKKNNLCLAVAIIGNLAAFYFTQSPLLCWIISVVCIIWAGRTKLEIDELNSKKSQVTKTPQTSQAQAVNKTKKIGNVIGIIIGLGLIVGPLIAYVNQEASLRDGATQGLFILFAVIGGFMIINNIFKLFENDTTQVVSTTVKTSPKRVSKEAESEDDSDSFPKIRCRFCKKLYSKEYNGCPYCKKK